MKKGKFSILNFKFSISGGFTLIELLLIMGIITVISTFAVVNLIRPQTKSNLDSTISVLVSDLSGQQIKAMAGGGQGGLPGPYGVYFESNRYTLFKGSVYSPSDTNNFIVTNQGDTTLTNTFTSNQIVFGQRSGEVLNFSASGNTITITAGGESKTITINALGVISLN